MPPVKHVHTSAAYACMCTLQQHVHTAAAHGRALGQTRWLAVADLSAAMPHPTNFYC